MKWPAYERYKDSDSLVTDQIPEHWIDHKLKYRLNGMIAGGTPESGNDLFWTESGEGLPWVSIADITISDLISKTIKDITAAGVRAKQLQTVPAGSILYSIFASLGKVAEARVDLVTNQAILALLIKPEIDRPFLKFWLKHLEQFLDLYCTSNTQKNLNAEKVRNLPLVFPPFPEQTQIAAFLDHETAKIDRLIEKQQALISLLKEKRQAVISHAVTKGLNPHAPLKDSGIEWLGQVPAHWTVSKIKHVAEVESGHTPDKKIEAYWVNCDIPWVSLNDSTQLKQVDYITKTAFYLNEKGIANSSARKLPPRAVIFTRDASIGLSAITTREMAVSQHVIAWICNSEKVLPEYLLLVFYAMAEELERYTFGATIKTIGMSDVNTLVASFPSVPEQKQIADHIFALKDKLFDAVTRAEKLVHILQERRTALISAAVTGKIDVRHWQPPAPSE